MALVTVEVRDAAGNMGLGTVEVGVETTILGPLDTVASVPASPPQLQGWHDALESHGETRYALDGGAFHQSVQYDRALGWYTHYLRGGGQEWLTRANEWAIGWRDFFGPSYDLQPHNDSLHGVALHYLLTGDPESKRAVRKVAENYHGTWAPSLGDIDATYTDGRIQSRVLLSAILAAQLGIAGWDRTALDDLNKILTTQQPDGSFVSNVNCYGSLNFMTGMVLEALIKYHTLIDPDPRIFPAVLRAVTYLWDTEWQGQAFRYFSMNGCWGQSGLQSAQPDLNCYFPLPFYWLYAHTGNTVWRDRGDAILQTTVNSAWWGEPSPGNGAKQYNQQILTIGQAFYWRAQ